MRNLENAFKNKKMDEKKLLEYGFIKKENTFIFTHKICDGQFEMIISLSDAEKTAKVMDLASGEEYVLVDVEEATGEFVGNVRYAYESKLQEMLDGCTKLNIFKSSQAKEIIQYVHKKYGDELEFLWEKFAGNAIWRNKINKKWYAALLTITADKLNLGSSQEIEIIDLRYPKEEIENAVDGRTIYPGYHMNKKSWITIRLDGSMDTPKILSLLDNSYHLSIGNKCGIGGDLLAEKVFEYLTTIPRGKVVTYGQVAKHLRESWAG